MTTAGGFQLPSVKLSCIQYDSAVKKDHEGLDFSENSHLIASLDFYNVSCQQGRRQGGGGGGSDGSDGSDEPPPLRGRIFKNKKSHQIRHRRTGRLYASII